MEYHTNGGLRQRHATCDRRQSDQNCQNEEADQSPAQQRTIQNQKKIIAAHHLFWVNALTKKNNIL